MNYLFERKAFALFLAIIGYIVLSFPLQAQILTPSKWSFSVEPQSVKKGATVEFKIEVSIDEGWYLYSNDFSPDLGPLPLEVKFEKNKDIQLLGKLTPVGAKKKFDEIWGGEYTYFTKKALFIQKVKIIGDTPVLKGSYSGQVCTEKDGKCIPVGGDFEIKDIIVANAAPATNKGNEAKAQGTERDNSEAVQNANGETTQVGTLDSSSTDISTEKSIENEVIPTLPETNSGAKAQSSEEVNAKEAESEQSLWAFFLSAFGAGLLALLTPCVFPVIPMTVTFFTKRSGSRAKGITNALFYGFSIILIYTIIGTLVSRINGPAFANFVSTHWFPNVLFFAVFFIFGLSFLGLFELVLPSWIVNKADAQSDKGGYLGIFFMAFTLALVSFSCTGPIVGSVLVASAGGAVLKPIIGMFGFSLALALPFMFFAIFPQALKELPRSGGWLNTVKVVLGFLELALALKYLSVADLVYHWGILDREVYLAFWIVIFSLLGIYLLGKLRLPHDDAIEKLPVPRLVMAIMVLSFVMYMVPGMWGAPLKALSGYLPPKSTMDWELGASEFNANSSASNPLADAGKIKHADILPALPHQLKGFYDYKQALDYAKKVQKPLFIDFTGHGCVNCREMEEKVWSDGEVRKRLAENFVLVSLYVDDKTELPEAEWYTSTYDNKVKKTIGEQNGDFQIVRYNNNAQPLYVIIDGNEKELVPRHAYDADVNSYIKFLDEAVANYKPL